MKSQKEKLAEKKTSTRKSPLKDVLDGSILTRDAFIKRLPFILFLTFLAILYIANRFHSEKIIRETIRLQKEVQELRTESSAIETELMRVGNYQDIKKLIDEYDIDLQEPIRPPRKITIRSEADKKDN